MKLLKLIIAIFVIYFIRRFIQMYRAMKKIQEEQILKSQEDQSQAQSQSNEKNKTVINAEYTVID